MRSFAALLLARTSATAPSAACQAKMDQFCTVTDNCGPAIAKKNCDVSKLVAREDLLHDDKWRCYSPSSLTADLSTFSNGTCYCTRDGQLRSVRSACENRVNVSDAFVSGEDGYHTYRIPSLLRLANGDLLLFAEARKFNSADHDWNDNVTKRSKDGGKTWGRMQLVHGESTSATHVTIGNPAPIEIREHAGHIILVACRNNHDVFQMWSEDNGETWGNLTEITKQVIPGDAQYSHVATGPPAGLQLASGRLLIASDFILQPSGDWVSATMFSDDLGASWSLGDTVAGAGGNECQAAPAPNGSLLLNMRTKQGVRQFSWSGDGGASWSPPNSAGFNEGQKYGGGSCQGSMVRLPSSDRLVFSTPFAGGRSNMSLFVSDDSGASWASKALVDSDASAYSSLVALNSTHVGLAYEKGGYSTISYTVVAVDDKQVLVV